MANYNTENTKNNNFLYFESTQIPLKEVPFETIKNKLIDPTTGEPYKGIILEGVCAQFSDEPNNNNRIYDEKQYLILLEKLKQQIHSDKGVYGEMEHPNRYSINLNYISHKLLDVWYIPETKEVYCRVILLNTPQGKMAQEIIRSGGKLAISARAAGTEEKMSDGTLKAVTKLLVTYDLVYHPGFSNAVLDFKELNESQNFNFKNIKRGYRFKVYDNQLEKITQLYESYINMGDNSKCFQEYLYYKLNENNQDQKQQQKILQKNEPTNQQQKQHQLKKAVTKQLKQENKKKLDKLNQELFFNQVDIYQKKLEDKAYFDNSAGFINNSDSGIIQ